MEEDKLLMKDLIPKKYKHLLYKDECPELTDFLLLKYAEVYRFSKDTLRLWIWSRSKLLLVKKSMPISNEWTLDDGITIVDVDNRFLDDLIALGATKQRIYRNGKRLKYLENKLGHRIIPFNPELAEIGE